MWVLEVTTSDPVSVWLDYAQSAGTLGLLILLFFAIMTRKIVPGWTYDAMETDRNYYRDIAHKSVELADRQIAVAEVLADRAGVLEARSSPKEGRRSRGTTQS